MESHRGAGTCRHRLILESHSHSPFLKYRRPAGRSRGIFRILDLPHVYRRQTTYLLIGPFANKEVAQNVISYIETRFFRFLVLLIKNTQNGMKRVYSFVPSQDFQQKWTDEKLYQKYKLTTPEIAFIEKMVRPLSEEVEETDSDE